MSFRFTSEKDILSEEFRFLVLKEITEGTENLDRKQAELRKHEIYRDKNAKWVMEAICREYLKESTVEQMRNRVSNISICRKIINKLAQAYTHGVTRTAGLPGAQESVDALANELDLDTLLKKSDRYRQLFRNTMVQVVPIPCTEGVDAETGKREYDLKVKVLAPWEYDVIEDPNDRTKAKVVILTDFPERDVFNATSDSLAAQGVRALFPGAKYGDQRDEVIADTPGDAGRGKDRRFIWWTDSFHFTTDIKGKIVEPTVEDYANPIGKLPFVNITGDQDGQFWAQGGEDVPDGSILLNKKITDLNFIEWVQGWGQLVIAAPDVPKKLVGGPDNAFIFDTSSTDKPVQVFYATSNPPIEAWLKSISSHLAMLLSTNNLAPGDIATELNAQNVASGVSLMIENSEILVDLQETQKLYQDKEPLLWDILARWHRLYAETGELRSDLQEIAPMQDDPDVEIKFAQVKPPISEMDKLNQIKLRKDLGINTHVELLKIDNPDLSEEDLAKRSEAIKKEKADNAAEFAKQTAGNDGGQNADGQKRPFGNPNADPINEKK
jgi:hypothetical protein